MIKVKPRKCDIYCNRSFDCHRCTNDSIKKYIGCDVKNIDEYFDNKNYKEVTYYPCDSCEEQFYCMEEVKKHFEKHHTVDHLLKCSLQECDFATKDENFMIMHIRVTHEDRIRR